MTTYQIKKINNTNYYSYLIFSTSYLNPLDNLCDIETDLKGTNPGKVLFDLLLFNGFSSNRYIEAYFNGKHFVLSSFRPVKVDSNIKKESGSFYQKNRELLNNSILLNSQSFMVKKGKAL